MKIEILGTGCAKCKTLEENTKKAVASAGIFAQIEKVEDIEKIMDYGVLSTPGFVVNGEVKSTGKLLNEMQILEFIK